jgi:hypothetical protein
VTQGLAGGFMALEQFYAAEYTALKQEQIARIGLRETSLFTTLTVNMAVLAVYYTEVGSKYPIPLIVPLVSFVMFFIYAFNDDMVSRIRRYIVDDLQGKATAALGGGSAAAIFGWETHHRKRNFPYVARKLFRTITVWVGFSGLTLVALFITAPLGMAVSGGQPIALRGESLLALAWWAGAVSATLPYLFSANLLDL